MSKTEEKTYDYTRKHPHHLVVYFDSTMKSYQIIHPSVAFDQNWKALAAQVSGGEYYKYEVR